MSDFDNSKLDNSFYLEGDNTLKKPKKEDNNFQGLKQDINTFNDLKSELSNLLEEKPLKINFDNIKISY